MRQGQHKNRSRGRNNNQRRSGGNSSNRVFESNGPDVKVRGTAQTVADKYLQLARDAVSAGDIVMSESYFQHAEHYNRIIAANQSQQQQQQQQRAQEAAANESSDGEQTAEAAPGSGPQPVEVPSNDKSSEKDASSEKGRGSERRDRSEGRGNNDAGRSAKKEDTADVASFDGDLPQFLQKPEGDEEVAEKPKRARRSPTRSKATKAPEEESAETPIETASADTGDDAASDAEVVAG